MSYRAGNVPADAKDLPEFLIGELQRLQTELVALQDSIALKTLNVAPTRLYDGLVALADGTNWNPNSEGQGFYGYYASGWKRFGYTYAQIALNVLGSTSLTGATVTTNKPLVNFTQIWNAGAVDFTAIKANITDTASGGGSLLIDLQVGGVSKFNVDKYGVYNVASTGGIYIDANANSGIAFYSGAALIGSTAQVGFVSGTPNATSPDAAISRTSAGLLEVNNGTPGTLRDLKLRNLIQTEYQQLTEMTAPAAGAVNTVRLYAVDNGAGKTQLMALFNTGAAQQVAIQP